MPPKRQASSRPVSPPDEWKITDEWGIYDPEKAGIPALFRRLGRPVLRAAGSSARRERRRALRPQRTAEGVGLVLNEVRARAGLLPADEHPLAAGNPARAMRLALKAQAALNTVETKTAAVVPPAAPPEPQAAPALALPAPDVDPGLDTAEAAAPQRKRTGRKPAAQAAAAAPPEHPAPAGAHAQAGQLPAPEPVPAARPRGRRAAPRTKARAAEHASVAAPPAPGPVEPATTVGATAPTQAAAVKPGPPAPSPRRPRGPLPLAAWARAVVDAPPPDTRGADKRGFWRGIFRIPSEVALVEYAHGCRIHRLLVEAGDDHVPDFI